MQVTGAVPMNYALLRRMVLSSFGPGWRIIRGLLVVLMTLMALLTLITHDYGRLAPTVLICLAGFAFPEFFALLGWLLQRKLFTAPFRYAFTTSGIEIHTATTKAQVAWAGIGRVRTRRHVWLLRHGAAQLTIPRDAFSPEDQRMVDEFLAGRTKVSG
jgi:hypothetical protein